MTVGIVIPLVTSKLSGDDDIRFRTKSGALSRYVLDSLRGLSETIQYGQGERKMADMNAQSDNLSHDEERMKRTAGRNTAVTNTVILVFDLAMLFLSAKLTGFEGCLITTLALMSSFGPVVALASVGFDLDFLHHRPFRYDFGSISQKAALNNNKRFRTKKCAKPLFCYSTKPYLTLMRSSFSSMGSAAMRMKTAVAAAWIRSMGRPDT